MTVAEINYILATYIDKEQAKSGSISPKDYDRMLKTLREARANERSR